MKQHNFVLDGSSLTLQAVQDFIEVPTRATSCSTESHKAVRRAHDFLRTEMNKKILYGVNTGFGPMASHIIAGKEMQSLQFNLVRSHAMGIGEPIHPDFVLASMLVRLNTLAKGYSGVSPELIERLELFINQRILPVVPEHGAVGTSGDLVQLAHIALALIGEGEVLHKGMRQSTADVLKKLGIPLSYKLQPKEGLSLINGTSVMTGIAALVAGRASRLLSLAVRSGALALELVRAFDDSIAAELHATRPHPGQVAVAGALRDLVASSQLMRKRSSLQKKIVIPRDGVEKIPEGVQEVYSFRCLAQILGPVYDIIRGVSKTIEIEMNAATDNPIVDAAHRMVLHGGNFHGDYIAAAVDQLKIGMVKLTLLSERRINFFLNNNVNKHLPPFLNLQKPGLTLALQGLQFVATSTTAQNQTLAFPHSIHSISTNADNQDVVSMGTDAALMTAKVVENAFAVMAIELVTLAQAVDVLGVADRLSKSSRELFEAIRVRMPAIREDRVLGPELHTVLALAKETKPLAIFSPAV